MNNYTTIEQSKKLIELGFDINTADAVYIKHCTPDNPKFRFDDDVAPMLLKDGKEISDVAIEPEYLLPCWTAGRLFELLPTIEERNPICCRIIGTNEYHVLYNGYAGVPKTDTMDFASKWDEDHTSLIGSIYCMMIYLLENGLMKKSSE